MYAMQMCFTQATPSSVNILRDIIRELVDEKLGAFMGEIWQVPPVYSAVKVDGKRAFDYAQKG
jgi:tRNA U55 pseudouridine synthase TruB